MLNTIREKTQGIIATFILVLLVIPFALWGINSYFEGGPSNTVAKVDGTEISKQQYLEALERYRGRVEPGRFESGAFKELVLSGLVDQTLMLQDVSGAGYRVSEQQLARLVHAIPVFQRNGRFDLTLFHQFLRREGLSEQAFLAQLRADITTRQAQSGLVLTAIVTEAEISRLAQLLVQRREAGWLRVPPEPLAARVRVTPEDVKKFYESRPDRFKTPEEVRIQFVRLSIDDLRRRHRPTEAEIVKAYQDDIGRYSSAEQRRVAHILIPLPASAEPAQVEKAGQQAEALQARLKAGADFAALARQHSGDKATAARGGDLGEVKPGKLPKFLEAAARALKPGEVSDPIQTPAGFHLVKLTSRPSAPKPLAAVRAQVIEQLRKQWSEERFAELGEKLRNLAYENPDSLSPVANTLELEIQQSGWFTRSGGQGLASHLRVVETAFSPELVGGGRNSEVIEVDRQTLVAIRVVGHRPSTRKPLEQVRAEIERQLRQQSASESALALARQLLNELRQGGDPQVLVRRHGIELVPARVVSREAPGKIDPRLLEAVFRTSRPEGGKPGYELVEGGSQGPYIVILRQVIDVRPEQLSADVRQKVRRLLEERRGNGYFEHYRDGLRQQADIRIHKERL